MSSATRRVSLLVVDPDDTARFIQIRGTVELVTDGAVEHLDALTRRYTRHPRYYGFVYPAEQAAPRDTGHLSHPRSADHPRRDPQSRTEQADRPCDSWPIGLSRPLSRGKLQLQAAVSSGLSSLDTAIAVSGASWRRTAPPTGERPPRLQALPLRSRAASTSSTSSASRCRSRRPEQATRASAPSTGRSRPRSWSPRGARRGSASAAAWAATSSASSCSARGSTSPRRSAAWPAAPASSSTSGRPARTPSASASARSSRARSPTTTRRSRTTRSASAALRYLQDRGFSDATISTHQLGYSPDTWDSLTSALKAKRSATDAELEAAGLVIQGRRGVYDRFRGRVMFPIRDASGNASGLGGRILEAPCLAPRDASTASAARATRTLRARAAGCGRHDRPRPRPQVPQLAGHARSSTRAARSTSSTGPRGRCASRARRSSSRATPTP